MFTIEDELNRLVKIYTGHQRGLSETGKEIDQKAREFLSELQKIKGWECMILSCQEHYARCPKEFFGWCSVTHTDDAVQFVKGYSDDGEYIVLNLSFRKSLKDQMRDRLDEIEAEKRKEETDEREKDLAELERIRKKYGL